MSKETGAVKRNSPWTYSHIAWSLPSQEIWIHVSRRRIHSVSPPELHCLVEKAGGRHSLSMRQLQDIISLAEWEKRHVLSLATDQQRDILSLLGRNLSSPHSNLICLFVNECLILDNTMVLHKSSKNKILLLFFCNWILKNNSFGFGCEEVSIWQQRHRMKGWGAEGGKRVEGSKRSGERIIQGWRTAKERDNWQPEKTIRISERMRIKRVEAAARR